MGVFINANRMILKGSNRILVAKVDDDANAFFVKCAEESELSDTLKNAYDLLVKRLKGIKSASRSTNVYQRAIKIFPRIGGTQFKCMLDAKNPTGTGLTKVGSGSLTFADNGITVSTTACMDTGIVPSASMKANFAAICISPKVQLSLSNILGCQNVSGGTDSNLRFDLRTGTNQTGGSIWRTLGTPVTTNTTIPGVYIIGRTGAVTGGMYVIKLNSLLMSGASAGSRPNYSTKLAGRFFWAIINSPITFSYKIKKCFINIHPILNVLPNHNSIF